MQTSIIGYPRIGAHRELKFASEKYFKGEFDKKELTSVAKDLRKNTSRVRKRPGSIS